MQCDPAKYHGHQSVTSLGALLGPLSIAGRGQQGFQRGNQTFELWYKPRTPQQLAQNLLQFSQTRGGAQSCPHAQKLACQSTSLIHQLKPQHNTRGHQKLALFQSQYKTSRCQGVHYLQSVLPQQPPERPQPSNHHIIKKALCTWHPRVIQDFVHGCLEPLGG